MEYSRTALRALMATICAGVAASLTAQTVPLRVNPAYGQGAVIQRNEPISIRGEASAGCSVSILSETFDVATQTVASDNTFSFDLSPLGAGGPYTYQIVACSDTLSVTNIYVGDVFLASGQSNMEWRVADSDDASRAVTLTDDKLRHLLIAKTASSQPLSITDDGPWEGASPETTPNFTAVGFYMAEQLRQANPDVPIGIIHASWGGSRIEAWLPRPAGEAVGAMKVPAETLAGWARLMEQYPSAFAKTGNGATHVDTGGHDVQVGNLWEWQGFPGINGEIYFDRYVDLAADQITAGATLSLGAVDDIDSTWVNGHLVGTTVSWDAPRSYAVPSEYLQRGSNRITVWVNDMTGNGGMYQSPDSIRLSVGGTTIPLGHDGWKARPRRLVRDSLGFTQQLGHVLYNAMLHPLDGVKASAAIWYQGESNAGNIKEAEGYGDQLRELVAALRDLSGQPALPFVTIELPRWKTPATSNYDAAALWPIVRTQQASVPSDVAASSVVTLDLGDSLDIHPRDKQPVGERAAYAVRQLAYDDASAPVFARAQGIEMFGQALTVRFTDVGSGLRASGEASGEITGFAVKDAAGDWHPATGTLQGADRLRIDSDLRASEIQAVAYGWADYPTKTNLVNGFGLPVSSFRFSMNE